MEPPTAVIDFVDDKTRVGRGMDGSETTGAAAMTAMRPGVEVRCRVTRKQQQNQNQNHDVLNAVERGFVRNVDGLECVLRRALYGDDSDATMGGSGGVRGAVRGVGVDEGRVDEDVF